MSEKQGDCEKVILQVKMVDAFGMNLQGKSEPEGQENFETISPSDANNKRPPSELKDKKDKETSACDALLETESNLEQKEKLKSEIAVAKVETEQSSEKQLYQQNITESECDGEYLIVDQLYSSQNGDDIESTAQTFYSGGSKITIRSGNFRSDSMDGSPNHIEPFSDAEFRERKDHSYHKTPDKPNLCEHVFTKQQNSNEPKICEVESIIRNSVEKKMDSDNYSQCRIQTDRSITCNENEIYQSENQKSGNVSSIVEIEQTNIKISSLETEHTTRSETHNTITTDSNTKVNESCTYETTEHIKLTIERQQQTEKMVAIAEQTDKSLGTKENNETFSDEIKNIDNTCANVEKPQIHESTVEANVSDRGNEDAGNIVPCTQTFYTEGMAVTIESKIFEEIIWTDKIRHSESEEKNLACSRENETCSDETKGIDSTCADGEGANGTGKQINESMVEANVSDHSKGYSDSIVPHTQTFYTEGMAVTIEPKIFEESIGTEKISLSRGENLAFSPKIVSIASSDNSIDAGHIDSIGSLSDSKIDMKNEAESLSCKGLTNNLKHGNQVSDGENDLWQASKVSNKTVDTNVHKPVPIIEADCTTDDTISSKISVCGVSNCVLGTTPEYLVDKILSSEDGLAVDLDKSEENESNNTNERHKIEMNRDGLPSAKPDDSESVGDSNGNILLHGNCLHSVNSKMSDGSSNKNLDNKSKFKEISNKELEDGKSARYGPEHAISDVQVMKDNYANLETNSTCNTVRNVQQSPKMVEICSSQDRSRENIVSDKNIMKRIYTSDFEKCNDDHIIITSTKSCSIMEKKAKNKVGELPEMSGVNSVLVCIDDDTVLRASESSMNSSFRNSLSLKIQEIDLYGNIPVGDCKADSVTEESDDSCAMKKKSNNTNTNSRPVLAKQVSDSYDRETILGDVGDSWKKMGLYRCPKCSFTTQDEGLHQIHLTTCSNKTSMGNIHIEKNGTFFSCLRCSYNTNMQPKFEEHLAFHIIAEPYICLACRKTFIGRKQVDAHIAEAHATETVQCGLRASSKIKEILQELDEKKQHNFVGRIKWKVLVPEKEVCLNLGSIIRKLSPSKTLETSNIQIESGRTNSSRDVQQITTVIPLLHQQSKTPSHSFVNQLMYTSAPSKPIVSGEVSRSKNTQVVKPLSTNNGKATQLVHPVTFTPSSTPSHTSTGLLHNVPAHQIIPVSAVGQNSFGTPVMLLNLPAGSSQQICPEMLIPASRVLLEQQPVFVQGNGATILTQPSLQSQTLIRMPVSLVPVRMTQSNLSNVTSNIPATMTVAHIQGQILQTQAHVTHASSVKSSVTATTAAPILVPATGHSKSSTSALSSMSASASNNPQSSVQKSNTVTLRLDKTEETVGKSERKLQINASSNSSHEEDSKGSDYTKRLSFRYVKKDCAYICYTCKKVTQQELIFRKHVHQHLHHVQTPVCTCGREDFNPDDQCTSIKNVVNGIYGALDLPSDLNTATFGNLGVQRENPIKGDLIIISDSDSDDDDNSYNNKHFKQKMDNEKQRCSKSQKSDSELSNSNPEEEPTSLKIVSTFSLSGIGEQPKKSDYIVTQSRSDIEKLEAVIRNIAIESKTIPDTTDNLDRTVELEVPDTMVKDMKEAIKKPGNYLRIKTSEDGDGQTILHLTDNLISNKLSPVTMLEESDTDTMDVGLEEDVDKAMNVESDQISEEKNEDVKSNNSKIPGTHSTKIAIVDTRMGQLSCDTEIETDTKIIEAAIEHQYDESTCPQDKMQEKNGVTDTEQSPNDNTHGRNVKTSQRLFEKLTDMHSFSHDRFEVPTLSLPSIVTLKNAVYGPFTNISNESERSFYVCGFSGCVFACLTSGDFKTHLSSSHKNASEYICAHCSHQSFTEDCHLRHLFNHSNSKTFVLFACGFKQCKFGTNLIQLFRDHMIKFHPLEEDFRCAACKEVCGSLDRLIQHMQVNLLKCVQCPYCSVKDGNRKVVLTHISSAHPSKAKQITVTSQLICQDKKINLKNRKTPSPPIAASLLKADLLVTNAKVTDDSLLNSENHLKQHSTSQTKDPILHSGVDSSMISNLSKSNMKKNTKLSSPRTSLGSSLKFPAKSQNRSDIRKVPVKRHADSLQCDQCSYVAWNSVRLAEHKSLHGSAPVASEAFLCIYCPMTVDRLSRYKSHISSHTGSHKITVYSCCHCTFKCNQSPKIESHVQHRHKNSGQFKNIKIEKMLIKSAVLVCSQCPYLTRCQKVLEQHLNEYHTDSRKPQDIETTEKSTNSINDYWVFKKDESSYAKGKSKPGSTKNEFTTEVQKPEWSAAQRDADTNFGKRFHCMYCVEQFCLLAHLKKHMVDSHESLLLVDGLTMFHCKACENFYSTKHCIVEKHFRKVHPLQKIDIEKTRESISLDSDEGQSFDSLADRFHCEMCSSTFKWKTELIEHRTKYHKKAHSSHLPTISPTIAPLLSSHKRRSEIEEDPIGTKMIKFDEDAAQKFVTTPVPQKHEQPKPAKFHLGGDDLHEKLKLCFECRENGFACLICRVTIVKKDVLHRHLMHHLRISFYKCFYCDFECLDFATIVPHISREHKKQVRYVHLDLHNIDERVQQGLQNLGLTSVAKPNHDAQNAATAGLMSQQAKTPQGKQSPLKHSVPQERHIAVPSAKYKCSYCKETTDSKPAMKRHIRSSHKGKDVTFSSIASILRDECSGVDEKTSEGTFVLPSKNRPEPKKAKTPIKQNSNLFEATTKGTEQSSQVTDKGSVQINVYRCLDCGIKTNSKSSMNTHFTRDKCNKPWYQCGHCQNFKSALKKTVSSHIAVRHKGKPLKIEILPLIAKSKCILPPSSESLKSAQFYNQSGACLKSKADSKTSVKCDKCNYSTSSLTEMEQHIECNHADTDLTCRFCNFEERNLNLLKKHCQYKHSKNLAFTLTEVCASDCSKSEYDAESESEADSSNIYIKEESESSKRENKKLSYICRFCRVSYDNRSRFWNHLQTHFGYKPFRCTYCRLRLSSLPILKKHIHTVHPRFKFQLKYAKNKSLEKMLNAIMEYCCSRSNKCSDLLPVNLMFFYRSDTNEYVCLKCNKVSQSNAIIESHVVDKHKVYKRNNEDIFETKNDQKIKKMNILKENSKHSFDSKEKAEPNGKIDVHRGQLKYTCNTCGMEKSSPYAMKYHQYNHSPIKFKCLYCGYVSCPRSMVTKHIRNVHRNKEIKINEVCVPSPSKQKHVDPDEWKANSDISVRIAPLPKLRQLPTLTKLDIHDSDDSVSSIFTSERSSDETDDEDIDRQSTTSLTRGSSYSGKIIYCCNECEYKVASLFHFRQHLTQHKGFTKLTIGISSDSRLQCGYCSHVAIDEFHFSQHVTTHLFACPFECGYCSFRQSRHSGVKNHIISAHPGKSDKNIINLKEALPVPSRNDLKLVHLDPQVCCIDVLGMSSECFEETLVEADISIVDLHCVPNEKFAEISHSFGWDAVNEIDSGSVEENDHADNLTNAFEAKQGDEASSSNSVNEDNVSGIEYFKNCLSNEADSIVEAKKEAATHVVKTSTVTVSVNKREIGNLCKSECLERNRVKSTGNDMVCIDRSTTNLTESKMTAHVSDLHTDRSKTSSENLSHGVDSLNSVDYHLKKQQNIDSDSSFSKLPEQSTKTDWDLSPHMPEDFDLKMLNKLGERQKASSCEPAKKRKAEADIDVVHACQKIKRTRSAEECISQSHFSIATENHKQPIISNNSSKNYNCSFVPFKKNIDEANKLVLQTTGEKPIAVDSFSKKSALVQTRKRSGSIGPYLKSSLNLELKDKTFKRSGSAEPTVHQKKEISFFRSSKESGKSLKKSVNSKEDHITLTHSITEVTRQESVGFVTSNDSLQEKQGINAETNEKIYAGSQNKTRGEMRDSPNVFDRMQKTLSGDLSGLSNEMDTVASSISNQRMEQTKIPENNCDSDSDLSTCSKPGSNIFDLFI